MTKKRILRTIALPLVAIAALYGAVTFVGCGSDEQPPPPPPPAFAGNVFLNELISTTLGTTSPNYLFMHNSSSPDKTKMFVVLNKANSPQAATTGSFIAYVLDLPQLEAGNVVKLAEATIAGTPGTTITFRSNWISNTRLVLAAANLAFDIQISGNPLTITELGRVSVAPNENHDALPTTDGAYAILALRTPTPRDGIIQLWRLSDHTLVGNTVSVCNSCHIRTTTACNGCHNGTIAPAGDIPLPTISGQPGATLCGLDGVVTPSGTSYSGTIYVAGHGGHFAKLGISINASNPAAPVIATPAVAPHASATLTKLTVSTDKFTTGNGVGTSSHKLHDARLDTRTDPDTIYWSTYNVDVVGGQNKLHYGKINASGGGLVDKTIDVDVAATKPTITQDAMPMYCGSGQTDTAFFPSTMTNKAYISVIPKANIVP